MDDSEMAVRSHKVVSIIRRVVLVVVISLAVVGAAASAEKGVSGSLTVNGKKVQLLYAYVDNVQPDEPIVVISNKPLPQDAIPFVPAKLVKEQNLYVIAFTISSKDKKLANGYGMLHHPESDTGVGFGRVEEGGLTLAISKLDANMIEGKISTTKPVKLPYISYSFDIAFKVKKK